MLSISPTTPPQTQNQQTQQQDVAAVNSSVGAEETVNKNESEVVNNAPTAEKSTNTKDLNLEFTEAEKKILSELKARDREVRAHEQAHAAVAGAHASGGPSYEYQKGPDGQLYAVGGHVSIDLSAVPGDPKVTLEKAEQVQRAALAPAQPSGQDRAVASAAASLAAEARVEISQEAITGQSSEADVANQTASETEEETAAYCAECGGQHASGSHNTSVALDKTFNSNTETNQEFLLNLAT